MPSFQDFAKRYSSTPSTIGQRVKQVSDQAMQTTWYNDVQTRTCYFYDYYHDVHAEQEYGYDPSDAPKDYKIAVDCKFIVKEYKSASKDEPEYHIQFSPEDLNNETFIPDYFQDSVGKFGVHAPAGLYVDIPDDRGVYWRWIVFYTEVANQFPKFGVMKCNYRFSWISDIDGHRFKRRIWGCERSQSSYTSQRMNKPRIHTLRLAAFGNIAVYSFVYAGTP